jgi:MinD-like ATPase involved in chromosome partitioning or flagellar assembly
VKPAPGQEELAHRANVRVIRQAAWPRSVRIAVASPKGGVGKTPTAILLAGILAQIRGGSVAVWDSADAANTLAARSEGIAARCISDIAEHPEDYTLPAQIAMAAATQTSSADVFGSLREREFDATHIQTITEVLDRTYRISVADTANTPHSPAYEAVLNAADTLVVPTIITADSVNKALSLLRRIHETTLATHVVVAVTRYGGPETPGLARQIPTLFHNAGVGAVVDIPFDSHIAQGTTLTLGALSHPSKVAWTRLAATVVTNTVT